MKTLKIMSVVGARPNFMKIAPFARAIHAHNETSAGDACRIDHFLVHTGQHYDAHMSENFFGALGIPEPNVDLGVGSGSHAEQVGHTMIRFEKIVREWGPHWIVVVGDVNATCACSITAKKEHLRLAHIEAGLRSFDLEMPEEINRMVTDRLADLLFTTDEMADTNLRAEGTAPERVERVGNIMIDTLEHHRDAATRMDLASVAREHGLPQTLPAGTASFEPGRFCVMTLHRPSNVDDPAVLGPIMAFVLDTFTEALPLVWPVHPRTEKNLKAAGLWDRLVQAPGVVLLRPVGYLEMQKLNQDARLMLTDSGGLQEECCIFGTPCLTLRQNTERPVTLVEHGGVSLLVGNDPARIREAFAQMAGQPKQPFRPPLWDGRTAERIVARLVK